MSAGCVGEFGLVDLNERGSRGGEVRHFGGEPLAECRGQRRYAGVCGGVNDCQPRQGVRAGQGHLHRAGAGGAGLPEVVDGECLSPLDPAGDDRLADVGIGVEVAPQAGTRTPSKARITADTGRPGT
jgi:hypothetical protein